MSATVAVLMILSLLLALGFGIALLVAFHRCCRLLLYTKGSCESIDFQASGESVNRQTVNLHVLKALERIKNAKQWAWRLLFFAYGFSLSVGASTYLISSNWNEISKLWN